MQKQTDEKPTPDCDDVAIYLWTTATLAWTILDKCFENAAWVVDSKEAYAALVNNGLNGGKTRETYEFVRAYEQIGDCLRILQDRIETAAEMCEGIAEREVTQS